MSDIHGAPAGGAKGGGMMKVLMSPPIILAGVAIGAVLLIMGKGASASTPAAGGGDNAAIGATVQMNSAALSAQTSQASINANVGMNQYNQDTVRQSNLLDFLANLNNSNNVVSGQIIEANAGITNNSITQSYLYAQDVNNNMTRLAQTYVSANVATAGQQANVDMAQISSQEAQNIAQTNQTTSILTSLIGAGTKVATAGSGL